MNRKLTTTDFINRSKKKWGEDMWDYSNTIYNGRHDKLKLICREHNHTFEQLADAHLKGKNGCFYCIENKMDSKKFIEKSKSIWGEARFNYDKVNYIDRKSHIVLICNEHNFQFEQEIGSHFRKNKGCKFCSNIKSDTEKFIQKSKNVWGENIWDYSKVNYIDCIKRIKLRCIKHNFEFEQIPSNHLEKSNNCKYCKSRTTEEFIEESKNIWGDKFDYSKVNYIRTDYPIILICKKHNFEFEQKPYLNLQKQCGCKICNTMSTEEFVQKANIIHNNRYDYNLVKYKKSQEKIKILCIKHNHIFEQTPNNHLRGNGCPICKSSQGELLIKKILDYIKVDYIQEKTFDDCKDVSKLKFDFYLPKYNKCIEFDGIQHFKSIKAFGGEEGLKNTKKRDEIKNCYCRDNNIDLLRIKYKEKNFIKILLKIIKFLQ